MFFQLSKVVRELLTSQEITVTRDKLTLLVQINIFTVWPIAKPRKEDLVGYLLRSGSVKVVNFSTNILKETLLMPVMLTELQMLKVGLVLEAERVIKYVVLYGLTV